jgi:hypothetical protein
MVFQAISYSHLEECVSHFLDDIDRRDTRMIQGLKKDLEEMKTER